MSFGAHALRSRQKILDQSRLRQYKRMGRLSEDNSYDLKCLLIGGLRPLPNEIDHLRVERTKCRLEQARYLNILNCSFSQELFAIQVTAAARSERYSDVSLNFSGT